MLNLSMIARCAARKLSAYCILSLLTFNAYAAPDTEPPSTPEQLRATAEMPGSIDLWWNASTDNRRVKHYEIRVNGALHAYSGANRYVITGLAPQTRYVFSVRASDGRNVSDEATVSATTLPEEASPSTDYADTSAKPGKGKGRPNRGADEPAEEPPAEEPHTGPPPGWRLVFADEFDGSGNIDTTSETRNWRFETLSDALHRAGNSGMDEHGNTDVPDWQSARGKRWSAWYDRHHGDNAYRSSGHLVLQGLYSGESDPTRPNDYYDNGLLTQYGTSKLYTAWLDTFSRVWSEEQMQHIADPAAPNKIFRYGYFEIRVNFSEMITPGFRLSWWLMPASHNADGTDLRVSNAYDLDGNNGIEIDIFEYEYAGEALKNHIVFALHGGAAGNDSSLVDASTFGVNLREGFHTIGLLWQPDRLVWTIDGEVVKEYFDTTLIPDVYSYMILSREMNSGVKRPGIDSIDAYDVLEQLPYRPRDPGLFAQNVWEFRHRLASDRALVDFIRIWQAP